MSGVKERLESVERAMQALTIRKSLLVEKALRGDNPSDILKAAEIFNQQSKPANVAPKAFLTLVRDAAPDEPHPHYQLHHQDP